MSQEEMQIESKEEKEEPVQLPQEDTKEKPAPAMVEEETPELEKAMQAAVAEAEAEIVKHVEEAKISSRKAAAADASESVSSQRPNRFESKSSRSSMEIEKVMQHISLREARMKHKMELDKAKKDRMAETIIQGDYKTRGLDYCYYCGEPFNVGERIPRILIHCGHTFCTECLQVLHHNYRVRCPICRKLVKQVESVDKLPLNFNILYEIVERDSILRDLNFEDEDCIECLLCDKHDQRVQHFYCSNHLTVFCRECIKEDHTDEKCFVVDLYEIEKMRKLHRMNNEKNRNQLEKRKDDADEACVTQEIPPSQVIGDSKWFVKRREQQQKAKEVQAKQQQAQLLKMKQNQLLEAKISGKQDPLLIAQDQFLAASSAPAGMALPPFAIGSLLESLNLQSFTPDQQAELLATIQSAQQKGNQAQFQQVLMAQLQKFQLQNAQKERLQMKKSLADPAQAYQQQTSVSSAFHDKYLLKGQQLPSTLHGIGDAQVVPAQTLLQDDRAQYKQTLGKFLSSSGGAKKKEKATRPGEGKGGMTGSDDTDSAEDEIYAKKILGARDEEKEKIQKKLKIFDDDDCEGEGSDDDDDDDDSGDDDEEYMDEIDDDSDQDDDLMSSGDSNGQRAKQSDKKQQAAEIAEKASFQTANEGEDDVKIVRTSDQMAMKPVEVIQSPAEKDSNSQKTGGQDDKKSA